MSGILVCTVTFVLFRRMVFILAAVSSPVFVHVIPIFVLAAVISVSQERLSLFNMSPIHVPLLPFHTL